MNGNELKAEDYREPVCPFCTDMFTRQEDTPLFTVPIPRIIEKLDEYLSRNDTAGAERHLKYWLGEADNGRDYRGVLAIRNEMMGFYRKQNDKVSAYENAEGALTLLESLGLRSSVTGATVFLNCATVFKAFGEGSRAVAFYEEARQIYETELSPNDTRLAGLYNNLAIALDGENRHGEAETYFRLALSIMKQTKNGQPDSAITLLNLADNYALRFGTDGEENEKALAALIEEAYSLLNDDKTQRDGYYAYVCEKCAPIFGSYGYFLYESELEKRAGEIYERT